MPMSTITSKGQTTIPIEIRDYLGVEAGDKVEYILQEDGKVMMVPATIDVAELEGILPIGKRSITLQDMQNAIEKHADVNS